MPGNYLHGVEVIEMSGKPSITSVASSVIGLIGTLQFKSEETKDTVSSSNILAAAGSQAEETKERDAKEKKEREALIATFYIKPYLVTSLDDFFIHFGKDSTGTLVDALYDIYSQMAAKVVVAPIKEAGNLDDGIKLLEKASENLNVDPKILIAPELVMPKAIPEVKPDVKPEVKIIDKSQYSTKIQDPKKIDKENLLKNNALLAEKLVQLAKKLKAVALVDLHAPENSLASIKSAIKELTESDRLYLLYPQVIVKRNNAEGIETDTTRPASSFVASLIVKSDAQRGFWFSPSNYKLSSIAGLSQEIAFTFGDSHCFANQLNAENITTIIWQGGYRLWGNKSFIKSGPAKNFEFLSVRRTADVLNMSLLKNHFWAIDQAITKNLKDTLVDSVNIFMRELKTQGAIINGKCWADAEKNSVESLANGQFYLNFDFTAPYPAERITFQSFLTKEYLSEVLA